MAAKFAKGDVVSVNIVVPTGPVVAFRMDDDGTIFCLVEWQDENGGTQQRWFPESQLTAS